MDDLATLERRAMEGATWRGHDMAPFERDSETRSHSVCRRCGYGAYLDTRPAPNGIDVHGSAVALNCFEPKERLEELRAALRAQNISMGELIELQGLADYIEPGDVELAEAAGIDEQEFAKR